jgi:hypothetical protein
MSENDNYYLSILIRSAKINNEKIPICGPGRLARFIVEKMNGTEKASIIKLSDNEFKIIKNLEKLDEILLKTKKCGNEVRNIDTTLFNSTRVNINPKRLYCNERLRSLIELKEKKESGNGFKEKEKVVDIHITDNNIERNKDNINNILGYVSKWILNK